MIRKYFKIPALKDSNCRDFRFSQETLLEILS